MGKTVDTRVVEMAFDNKAFERGVSVTLETLKKLKEKLDFKGATKSVEALGQSFKDFTLGKISDNVDKLNNKFSIFGIATLQIMNKLISSAIEWGKAILNSVTGLEAALGGLREYETQINAIQTIMANTDSKGTTMQEIMKALDELNTYADKTIYNFTEMTKNIGTFTAAGADLDTSVAAIKGIANAAALSGSNSQQAATAMYQLSQAISSGIVRAQDWMSVTNAGMGGEIFRNDLIETARLMGANAEALAEAEKDFRGSLENKWLTSEVLLRSLAHFTGDVSKEMLLLEGYTSAEADALIRLGDMATDAATKVKTFTQLKGTLKEVAESGWVQSWIYLLGDFEQARDLFTGLSDVLSGYINNIAEARNHVLMIWNKLGGRELLIDSASLAFEKLLQVLKPVGEAFREVFPPITGKTLFDLTVKLKLFLMNLEISEPLLKNVKILFKALFTVIKFVGTVIFTLVKGFFHIRRSIMEMAGGIKELLPAFTEWVKSLTESGVVINWINNAVEIIITTIRTVRTAFLDWLNSIIDFGATFEWIKGSIKATTEAIVEWWNRTIDVAATMEWLKGVLKEIGDVFVALWGWIKLVAGVIYYLGLMVAATASVLKDKFLSVLEKLQPTFQTIGNFFKSLGSGIKESFTAFKAVDTSGLAELGEKIKAPFLKVKEFFSNLNITIDTSWVKGIGPSFEKAKIDISKTFSNFGNWIKEAIGKLNFDGVGEGFSEGMVTSFSTGLQGFFTRITGLLSTGLLAALVLSVTNFLKNGSEVLGGITGVLDSVKDSLEAWQNNLKAQTLMEIAKAIALLAVSLFLLALIDPVNLTFALGALTTLFVELMLAMSNFAKMTGGGGASLPALITTLVGISVALLILSVALKTLSSLDYDKMNTGMQALTGISIILVVTSKLLAGNEGSFLKASIGMGAFALGILSMASVVRILGELDSSKVNKGTGIMLSLAASIVLFSRTVGEPSKVIASAVSMVILSGALIVLSYGLEALGSVDHVKLGIGLLATAGALAMFFGVIRYMPADVIPKAVGITILAGSLVILAFALEKLGNMDIDKTKQSIEVMAITLGILAIAMKVMQQTMAGALAMFVAAAALVAISVAFTILSKIPMEALGIGLLAIAGIFAILGLAGLLLAPLLPVIMGLSLALSLIAVGAFLFGVGILKMSVGLLALIGIGTAGIAVITGAIMAFLALLPQIITLLGLAFKAILDQIIINAPLMSEALTAMLMVLIQTFIDLLPVLAQAIVLLAEALAVALIGAAPSLIAAVWFLVMELMKSFRDNIGELTEVGMEALTNFINGMTEKLPELVKSGADFLIAFNEAMVAEIPRIAQSGFDTIVALVDELAIAAEENIPVLIDSLAKLGIAIIDGIIQGISGESITRLIGAISQIGANIIQWLKAALGIKSPSKPAIEIGKLTGDGLVKGLIASIKPSINAARELGKEVLTSLSDAVSNASDFFIENMDISPTIKPVVDMSNILASGKTLDNIYKTTRSINLSGQMRSASVIASNKQNNQPNDVLKSEQNNIPNVSFVQNNYSPEALSRFEIYRQTKNQIALLKGALKT